MPSTQKPRARSGRRREKRAFMLLFCLLFLVLFIVAAPREPLGKALNVSADGTIVSEHKGLVISEIMSDNASALPDENGNFPDWLELWNSTEADMNLKGLSLSNREDKAKFIFPDTVLAADGRVIIFCDNSNLNEAGRPFHAKFKLASVGCAAFLFDRSGYLLDSVAVPTLNANESWSVSVDGAFFKSEQFSPGHPNTPEGHDSYMGRYAIDADTLMINELIAAARSGFRDEDGELSDWIELYNAGPEAIDLSHYALSDNETRPVKWVFPQGAWIPPGGYYLVFCSGKDKALASAFPHANFSLSAEGETLTLSTRQGQLVDRILFPSLPADQSYGRNPLNGSWQVFSIPTPGASNDAVGAALADRYLLALNPTGVFVSEVMSSNDTVEPVPGQPASDWVELHNGSGQVQDLSGFGLSDSISWPRKWQFPAGTAIWPGEYKIVLLDKSSDPGTNAASLHASYTLAKAGGEVMTLSDPEGRVLDRIVLPELPANVSFGRTIGRDGFFYYDAPTPGAANGAGFLGFSRRPELSLPGGLYAENLSLSISGPDGAQLRYTTDGSIPTLSNSMEYRGPFGVSDTCVIRARSFEPGLQPSETVTATYVLKTYYTLPVVCLAADPDELWNAKTGMYAAGEGVDLRQYEKIPFRNPDPVYRLYGKVQRPGYAEMFDNETGGTLFSQGATFGLIGQYSLDMPQKSFKVTARAAYGNRYFQASLFEDRPFEEYKSFVLRVSGNDCVWTRMVDGVQSRLVDLIDTTVIHQAWQPVIVYLNGQYWGHYNLRERVSRYFVAQHEGIPMEEADGLTILEGNGASYYGSNAEYRQLVAKAKTLSPGEIAEDLKYLTDNIDIDNYFDYMIFEAFFANTDTGNIRFYKVPGSKWKWILFDLDYGLFNSTTNGIKVVLNPKGTGVNNAISNVLIRKILENREMQDRFLRRFGEIFRALTTPVMLAQVNECHALLQPEMQMHFERWASLNLKSISSDQPLTVDGCLRYWNTRVDRLRNVVKKRPTYCYDQVKEWFSLTDAQMAAYFGPRPAIPPDAI